MNEHQLDQRLAGLQREVAPGRDLWPGIEQRIDAGAGQSTAGGGGAARYPRWFALAASVLLLVAIGRVFLPSQTQSDPAAAGQSLLAVSAAQELQALDQVLMQLRGTPEEWLDGLGQSGRYGMSAVLLGEAAPVWRPQLIAGLQENQKAIISLRTALSQQPEHISLLRQLANAERRQHRLLRQWADFNRSGQTGILLTNTTNDFGEKHA